jgi:nitroreductase
MTYGKPFKEHLYDSILKSQRCQRNWNLEKQIPQEDLDLMIHAATQCPSKHNMDFYNLHVITNRDIIDDLYLCTSTEGDRRKNPQVLSNVLFAFTKKEKPKTLRSKRYRRVYSGKAMGRDLRGTDDDFYMAISIAAGYLCLTANLLGYSTGFCRCFDPDEPEVILKSVKPLSLALGVGYPSEEINRIIDHDTGKMIESFDKSSIDVIYHT